MQNTPCTWASSENLSGWHSSSAEVYSHENQLPLFSLTNSVTFGQSYNEEIVSGWQVLPPGVCSYENQMPFLAQPNFVTFGTPNFISFDQNTAASGFLENIYPVVYNESWNPVESSYVPDLSFDNTGAQSYVNETINPCVLQYGLPTVTDSNTISVLLKHLVRIDLTLAGTVCINNFPAKSVIALNPLANKCYISHPNGKIFQDGSVIHMMTGNRMIKMSRTEILFSILNGKQAYVVDKAGTKTCKAWFMDLSKDLSMDVLNACNLQVYNDSPQACYKLLSELKHEYYSGNELWTVGGIQIKQDRWGNVTVFQNALNVYGCTVFGDKKVICTSPTVRSVNVKSCSESISIDCDARNYLTVKKGNSRVTSECYGLILQYKNKRAGFDRKGKLALL